MRVWGVLFVVGCGSTAPEVCNQYLDCLAVAQPGSVAVQQALLGDGGTCWSDSQENADRCAATCEPALDLLRQAAPVAECWPEYSTFLPGVWEVTGSSCSGWEDPVMDGLRGQRVTLSRPEDAVFSMSGLFEAPTCTLTDDTFLCPGEAELRGSFEGFTSVTVTGAVITCDHAEFELTWVEPES